MSSLIPGTEQELIIILLSLSPLALPPSNKTITNSILQFFSFSFRRTGEKGFTEYISAKLLTTSGFLSPQLPGPFLRASATFTLTRVHVWFPTIIYRNSSLIILLFSFMEHSVSRIWPSFSEGPSHKRNEFALKNGSTFDFQVLSLNQPCTPGLASQDEIVWPEKGWPLSSYPLGHFSFGDK